MNSPITRVQERMQKEGMVTEWAGIITTRGYDTKMRSEMHATSVKKRQGQLHQIKPPCEGNITYRDPEGILRVIRSRVELSTASFEECPVMNTTGSVPIYRFHMAISKSDPPGAYEVLRGGRHVR